MHREKMAWPDMGRAQGAAMSPGMPGAAGSRWKLEEARKPSSLEPSEGAWPCQFLGFRLLASRTENFCLRHSGVLYYGSPRKLPQCLPETRVYHPVGGSLVENKGHWEVSLQPEPCVSGP